MHDDLGILLRSRADDVLVPPSGLDEVVRDGRRRRLFRRVTASAAAALVALGMWLALMQVPQPRSSGVGPAHESADAPVVRPLIVVPAPEGAGPVGSPEAVADAKAVTFAFHALANTVGYDFDYKNFERTDEGWIVSFLNGATASELREVVTARRDHIDEDKRYLDEERHELEDLMDDLERARESDNRIEMNRLRLRFGEVRASIASLMASLQKAHAELQQYMSRLQRTLEQGGPERIELTVKRSDQVMVVVRVSAPFDEVNRQRIRAYSEPIAAIDVHGVDWYNVSLVGAGVIDDVSGIRAYGFWTGPIPSTYKEECLKVLRDPSGIVVFRQPDTHDVINTAPPTEDGRDGWIRGGGVDLDEIAVPAEQLIPDFECRAVD